MGHPPHSPDLAPSDFHLFGPMKVHLGGYIFQNDDESTSSILNWLCIQNKSFCAAGTRNLPGWGKQKCVSV
jgi:hypothetical protein